MKLMFASDIHGSAKYAELMRDIYMSEKAEKLILLGDLLYHGPRNDLPEGYEPKRVINLLNEMKGQILAVRGNCDAEVDQMVLEFPIMADYIILWLEGHMVFVTHGHKFNEDEMPMLGQGDILIHGHTHLRVAANRGDYYFFNPGSISLPKGDGEHSYMIYEDGVFTTKTLGGKTLEQVCVK